MVTKWNPFTRECPSRKVLDRVGDRWTVLVIGALEDGPLRYTELRRRVDGVSQKMLTQTLRGLERDGLVARRIYPEIPPRVEYTLTPMGRSLREPLAALRKWALDHMDDIVRAQQDFDDLRVPRSA